MAAVNWGEHKALAEDIQRRLWEVARRWHSHLDENGVTIVVNVRDDSPKRNGRDAPYGVRKVTGENAWIAREVGGGHDFFCVWVPKAAWDLVAARGKEEAYLDAILCHFHSGHDEDTGRLVLQIVKPEFQGHYDNVKRFGAWHREIAAAFNAFDASRQLTLDMFAAMGPGATGELVPEEQPDEEEDDSLSLDALSSGGRIGDEMELGEGWEISHEGEFDEDEGAPIGAVEAGDLGRRIADMVEKVNGESPVVTVTPGLREHIDKKRKANVAAA